MVEIWMLIMKKSDLRLFYSVNIINKIFKILTKFFNKLDGNYIFFLNYIYKMFHHTECYYYIN